MTWEQAVAAALAIAVTALARLVDRWLPPQGPSLAHPGQIPPEPDTRRVPYSDEVEWVDERESRPATPPPRPQPPRQPPTEPPEPPVSL
jgi:hypothetical protein